MFTVADPQNWVALFAFLATALVASHLSDREKKQADDAKRRQRETEQLYALSRAILLTEPSQSVGSQAARHISEIFECPGVALYEVKTAEVFRGGADDLLDIEPRLKQVAVQGNNFVDPPLFVAAILLGGQPIGSLALKGSSLSDGALQALLNLVAIALERVRMENAANRADAARQSEEFKSTLLDAIAHEFKTPLTSIKAASTSMLADALTPQFRELAAIIDEETDRMNQLVTEAVRMSQIDAGKIRLERESVDVAELLPRVLENFDSQAGGRALRFNPSANLPHISADPELLSLALRQLIDNALKYSPPGSPIGIVADLEGDRVVIRVHDRGPGIPERERERVFDKFYRRAPPGRAQAFPVPASDCTSRAKSSAPTAEICGSTPSPAKAPNSAPPCRFQRRFASEFRPHPGSRRRAADPPRPARHPHQRRLRILRSAHRRGGARTPFARTASTWSCST